MEIERDADWESLRRDIDLGIAQADHGLTVEFDEAALERIKSNARARDDQKRRMV